MKNIPEAFSELRKWIKPLCRYGKIEDFFLCDDNSSKLGLRRLRLTIFTKEHQYHISAYLPENEKFSTFKNGKDKIKTNDGYLGCIVETRKPRAGERWNRGNDLADGSYSKETFDEIVHDILAYELVKVVKPQKEQVDELPKVK